MRILTCLRVVCRVVRPIYGEWDKCKKWDAENYLQIGSRNVGQNPVLKTAS